MPGEWIEQVALAPALHLPPRELRYFDLQTSKRIETPLDEATGLVDRDKLMAEILKTVDQSYDWQSAFSDVHHLQWPNRWYDALKKGESPEELTGFISIPNNISFPRKYYDMSPEGQRFRNINSNKVVLPRVFHNWLHIVSFPPPVPANETIHDVLEVDTSLTNIHNLVSYSRFLARQYRDANDTYASAFRKNLDARMDTFGEELDKLQNAPIEFRPTEVTELRMNSTHDMVHIANVLGRYASSDVIELHHEAVRQELMAA
ncbi:MAG: hypothetical protein JWM52_354 [Candidatus Saccharibacteria bacterium]|nr:hypothetical protein [Candidatus Saccharibacteria bacterium]